MNFAAAEFAGLPQAEEKQRRTDERKGDADQRGGDGAERQEVQQHARAESGDRGACRFAPGKVVGELQHSVEVWRSGVVEVVLHGNKGIAARRPAARMAVRKNFPAAREIGGGHHAGRRRFQESYRRHTFMEQSTLLIVNESAADRATLIGRLSREAGFPYRVLEAASVAEGLCKLAEARPGAVAPAAAQRLDEQRVELERLYREARTNNDALRDASAAKDEFLAMLSHELRTPLTPVLSLVSATLGAPGLPPDLRETFAMIQRNVELEARLIDDLLDLTQIASGRLKIERRPVNIHACIEASLDVCQQQIDDRKITIHTELGAAEPMVQGDFARLNQVLWNLLKNAVKFSPPDGRVAISTANEGGQVVIEIRDDGLGIEPERLASIFGAFSRGNPEATATGLGLGLAITRAIVEGHGGEICARSAGRGCGAVFRVGLPGTSAAAAPGETPSRGASEAVRGKTIMVVEDHEDTRRVLARVLRRKGFGVTAAGSVAAAVAQFAGAPPDLIICDIGLPDGTGWELLEKLRPRGPVRAIAVSGYGMNADVEKSREVGFAAHLTKPIDFQRLETLIVQLLTAETPR